MCAPVIVTEENARDLITQAGNPHLIWDGAEARVITEDFYDALHAESAWLLIITRDDLIAIAGPEVTTYADLSVARSLTDIAEGQCLCTPGASQS